MFGPACGIGDAGADRLPDLHRATFHHLAVAPDGDLHRARAGALILDPEGDRLLLADDAEPRRRGEHDAAVALIAASGHERMHGRRETEFGDVRRHIMDATVGNEHCARHPIGRHVCQRGTERREQLRSVGFAVRLAGFDELHLEPLNAAEPFGKRCARGLGLLQAFTEILAGTAVDDDDRNRGQRLAVLACERGIGEREHQQCERTGAHQRAAAARQNQQRRDDHRGGDRRPQNVGRHQRREGDPEGQSLLLLPKPLEQGRDVH